VCFSTTWSSGRTASSSTIPASHDPSRTCSPAVELVVVVGVVELFRGVDVASVHDPGARLARVGDQRRHRVDDRLARRRVETPVGVTEAVLHIDDDHCGVVGIVWHNRR